MIYFFLVPKFNLEDRLGKCCDIATVQRILINMNLMTIGHNEHREAQEDFYDVLVSQARKDEPKVDWEDLKAEMVHEETGAK